MEQKVDKKKLKGHHVEWEIMMKGLKVKSNKRRMGRNIEWEIRRTEIMLKVCNK